MSATSPDLIGPAAPRDDAALYVGDIVSRIPDSPGEEVQEFIILGLEPEAQGQLSYGMISRDGEEIIGIVPGGTVPVGAEFNLVGHLDDFDQLAMLEEVGWRVMLGGTVDSGPFSLNAIKARLKEQSKAGPFIVASVTDHRSNSAAV